MASGDVIKNRPRKGSAKIGAMCPAHMFYTECDDGLVNFRWLIHMQNIGGEFHDILRSIKC